MNIFVAAVVLSASLISAFNTPAFAQSRNAQTIQAYKDFIVDLQPKGFTHVHEQGSLNKFIIEYIPEGESLKNWTRMLSILSAGYTKPLPEIKSTTTVLFRLMKQVCQELNISNLPAPKNEARFRVACDAVAPNMSLPGGAGLQWEIGVYRFVKTEEAIYQIHYVEHGVEPLDQNRREETFAAAANAVDKVVVCQLDGSSPCPNLDLYLLERESQPLKGEPPCRSNDAVHCNPSAFFNAPLAAGFPRDDSAKKALLLMDFSKEDPSSPEVLRYYTAAFIKNLRNGRPGVTLVVRGPSQDYAVTNDDRARVGTFLQLLRRNLVRLRVVDANAMQFTFLNFR